jgi:hypothetical protein
MVEVVVRIVAAGVVADPLLAIDVWGVGVAGGVGEVAMVFGWVWSATEGLGAVGRRWMRGFSAMVAALLMLGIGDE